MQGTRAQSHTHLQAHIHKRHTYTSIHTCKAYIYLCIYAQCHRQTHKSRFSVHPSVTHMHIHIHADRLTYFQPHTYMTCKHIHEGTHRHAHTRTTFIKSYACAARTQNHIHTVSETINVTICYPLNTSDSAHACKHTHACNAYTCTYTYR